jgi:hypothetical protein
MLMMTDEMVNEWRCWGDGGWMAKRDI